MELRRPELTDKTPILEMVREFQAERSPMDGGFLRSDMDFDDWVKGNQELEMGLNLPEGFVPAIQLVSFDDEGQALGFLSLRLWLNDFLLEKGGHIGYSIRPSKRGQGLAKEQLRQGLLWAREKNIKKALVTCKATNIASQAVILANGGQLEDVRDGIERYWIEVE